MATVPAPMGARAGWRERWPDWRNRLLANPRFRHWAAGFLPTRWLARRRAAQLFDLVAGFVYSQVLLACLRLGLFDLLAAGALGQAQIAARVALDEPACARLLAAAAALRLVEPRSGGRWGLGPLGATLVGDRAIRALVEHHDALYADLADPVALLRAPPGTARLARWWPYAAHEQPRALSDERVAAYSALMAASQPLVAEQVLDAVSLGAHRCLLDVGGGEGAFLRAVAARAPGLQLMLFDLPAVAQRAQRQLAAQGLAGRVQVCAGDFLRDPLPQGADLLTLVRVVHDHDDEAVARLLRAAHAALPPGGRLLLAEPMADTPGVAGMGDAYFGLYLLAMGQGQPRSARRLSEMLAAAGFVDIRPLPTRQPLQTGLISARVPPRSGVARV